MHTAHREQRALFHADHVFPKNQGDCPINIRYLGPTLGPSSRTVVAGRAALASRVRHSAIPRQGGWQGRHRQRGSQKSACWTYIHIVHEPLLRGLLADAEGTG